MNVKKIAQRLKKIVAVLFVAHLVYLLLLKWINPPVTATQLADWFKGYGLRRHYVSLQDMSHAPLAVMAGEDQLFPRHNGFDWKSIEKAMEHNERRPDRPRGASTLSQQTAKNVFLWQGGGWLRKGLETYFTFMIEKIWGKKRILEVYMNVAEMGPGVFGIEAASQAYFRKPAKQLTRTEASQIAACLPNPKKYKVKPLSPYVARHSAWIIGQMNFLAKDKNVQQVLGRNGRAKIAL